MSSQTVPSSVDRYEPGRFAFERVIDDICRLNWTDLSEEDLTSIAWAYYYFSTQFRECLEIARQLYSDDPRLLELDHGERDTDNLSPWPGVAAPGEKMNHDEFMRRTLALRSIPERRQRDLTAIGEAYLSNTRGLEYKTRAMALASYEDGGLERIFGSILTASQWTGPLLQHSNIFSRNTSDLIVIRPRVMGHFAGISRPTTEFYLSGWNSRRC